MTSKSTTAARPRRATAQRRASSPHRNALNDRGRLAELHRLGLLDSPPEVPFDRLTRLAAKIVRAPVSLVSLVETDRQFFLSEIGLPEPWSICRQTPLSHSFCQHVVCSGEPLAISDARLNTLVADNLAIPDLGVVAYLGMPLASTSGHVLGSFCVIDGQPRDWSEDQIDILRDLACSVMTEIELRAEVAVRLRAESALRSSQRRLAASLRNSEKLNSELERKQAALVESNAKLGELATTDGLTGLKNRRFFDESLRDAFALMERLQEPVSVVIVDVDKFKQYNDTYGHPAGDNILRRVATVLREQVRGHETVARYGGEEFAMLLLGADAEAAALVAERVRAAIEAEPWPARAVTASFGVATSTPDVDPVALVKRADEALYVSKRDGRNRVTSYSDLPMPTV